EDLQGVVEVLIASAVAGTFTDGHQGGLSGSDVAAGAVDGFGGAGGRLGIGLNFGMELVQAGGGRGQLGRGGRQAVSLLGGELGVAGGGRGGGLSGDKGRGGGVAGGFER